MPIETITLERTGKAPLRFTGELVQHVSGQFVNTPPLKPNKNWWEIAIYSHPSDSPLFIVAITYHNEHRGHYQHRAVEAADDPAKTIAAYHPLDVLQGFPPGEVFAGRQAHLERTCLAQWDALVGAVLQSFPEDLTVPAAKGR